MCSHNILVQKTQYLEEFKGKTFKQPVVGAWGDVGVQEGLFLLSVLG